MSPYSSQELTQHFRHLDHLLTEHRALWLPQPFTSDKLDWCDSHPHLSEALLSLGSDEATQLHDQPQQRLQWFARQEPELCAALSAFEPIDSDILTPLRLNRFDQVDIPGRKWQQIKNFASALPLTDLPIVDWCAGKGHLSRIVERSQARPVHCLEWDPALVSAGQQLAQRTGQGIHYHQHDVMQSLPASLTGADYFHIALHACGQLHLNMLQQLALNEVRQLALSPCCYHKISSDSYQPLSAMARQSQLQLNRQSLHLAVQDTVTARRGERLLREQERRWRLGFDCLQRAIGYSSSYLNVPSCKRSLLRQGFPAFCQWAAREKGIELPGQLDYEEYLQQGIVKHQKVFRLELLRRIFNRPLELWLVLDRALYLVEKGYKVRIQRFCDATVSPRNLLIQAQRS